ncbi:MAG: DUF1080 domain-containing protein, partial [Planctomycetales bacterium]|nr:DUF1080 domain-containing protein [Planctomycetales bacterium]
AGIDYTIQGEYSGSIKTSDGEETWGAQVVALGDGKFELVGFKGGLPGAGWSRGDEMKKYSGALDGEKAVFKSDESTVEISGGKLHVSHEGTMLGALDKVERKSPTLGAEPPKSAIVLFDGSSVDHWNNGKLVEGKWLGATNCETKQKFGDHTLHIEFRTPYMPAARGQGRGNSGVYVQSRYEVQVLDSFGLEGKDNECGGIYSINRPIVNMCLPPLAWQTYDIDFTAARYDESGKKVKNGRITIKHNGVVIHDDQELAHGTPGRRAEGPGPDALFLQDHGNPVVFRNVWVVEK